MSNPKELKYTKDHEWAKSEGDHVIVGITNFAQSELGDLVFVDLPVVGKQVKKGEAFCVVESTKAASDVYSPLTGEVAEVNEALKNDPSAVNSDPFGAGWLVKLKNVSGLETLMSAEEYDKLINL